MLDQQKSFTLKGNIEFNDRQKSIFDVLDKLTPAKTMVRYSEDEFKKSESKTVVDANKKDLKQFRGQESIFKKPEMPKKRSLKIAIPDFVRNPHKWKKYKMGGDVMTDKSNTAAAMSFLKEMKERREPMDIEKGDMKGPILFNRHIKADGEKLATEDKETSTFVNGKRVMPEYVVGQKIKKTVTFKTVLQSEFPASTVKLGHLFNDDDEEA
ncbi:uncharacterized protein [Halyomorpha halys]|uniref:uncharacterized protein n=1 Tax=Halyomorpha halys TaxID=286706 RepID=UPI0006D515AA|nr:uncharacterized protein LOC106692182 [Halyomorpha halys]